jgi:hypothetical protein
LKLSVDQFFELSWYELTLHLNRYDQQEKEKKFNDELEWLRIRKIWVLMINYMRDSKTKTTPFKETDLIKLSFDKEEEQQKPMSPEEVEKLFPKTLNINK